jgi:addiction module HigA family antidote
MIRLPTHRPPTHPGTFLLHDYLEPLGMTQRECAKRLGITAAHLSELIHAKRAITPETALRLEKLFGTSAQFWLNGQLGWDLWHAMRAPKVQRIVKKIQPVKTAA